MNGADVITASYGGFSYSHTEAMVHQAAAEEGALVVAAAGNEAHNADRQPSYPAGYIWTLGVGGTRADSDINYYNYGRSVNVFAPGRDVWTTQPDGGYGTVGGTSFAVPLVAGIDALVKVARPHITANQLREQPALQQTTLIRRTMRPLPVS